MRFRGLLPLATLLVTACGTQETPESDAPDTDRPAGEPVATWDGGAITFPEVEERVAVARTPACQTLRRAVGSLDDLVPCYRESAEGLVLEELILAEIPDIDQAISELEGLPQQRGQIYLDLYLRRLQAEIDIDAEELRAHYDANRHLYRRPGEATVWNIFRRHEDPGKPEQTIEFLRALKERYLAGETFGALARENSHSETRLRDGFVGRVQEGRLPKRLEEIAFALDDGEVSEPIRVKGGAVLLLARNVVPGLDLSFEEAQAGIRRQLLGQRIEERIAERAGQREPPPGSTILPLEDLVEALDGDRDRVILDLGENPLTVARFRGLARLADEARVSELSDELHQGIGHLYRAQQNRKLVLLDLQESDDPELRESAEERLRASSIARVADSRLREEIWQLVDADPERLKRYWADNRHHYQSPLRFMLYKWDLPFGDDPPEQLRRMEELRESLEAGEITLAAAAEELGGRVEDLGWRDFDSLTGELNEKGLTYLIEVGEIGFSIPYQGGEALHLVWLKKRQEPRALQYDEAQDRVRGDYYSRFQQELYRQARDTRLSASGFVFEEAAIRNLLAPSWRRGSDVGS